MAEKYQNDLMHLQNELLGDIKNVENKIDAKIKKINLSLEEQKNGLEKKVLYLENAYNVLLQRTQNVKNNDNPKEKEILSKIENFNKKIEDYSFRLENKINAIKTEFKDISYKYDKVISDNFQIPGLIGYRAPFQNFREFIENLNKRLNDSIKLKDQQVLDLKKYKEKMDSTLSTNKNQFALLENKLNSKNELQIKDLEKRYNERINILEERINSMRIENGKYSYDLLTKCNDLNDKCDKIDSLLKSSLDEYNQEFAQYKNTFNDMNEKLNNFEGQYKIFEERLKLINEQFEKINKNSFNFIMIDKKIKEIEKMCLSMKSDYYFSQYEDKRNKSNILDNFENNDLSKSNNMELYFEENEKNSFFTNKQIKKLEVNFGKKEQKNFSARNHIRRKDLCISEEKNEHPKQNNIIYSSEFAKNSRNFKETLDIVNKKYYSTHVTSGKIFNRFPFISYDRKGNNEDIIKSLNINERTKKINKAKIGIKDNNNNRKEKERKFMSLALALNLKKLKELKQQQINNESKDKNNTTYLKYKYLDKKIDILARVMVDSLNKIILQMNYFRKNNFKNDNFQPEKNKENMEMEENSEMPINSIKNYRAKYPSKLKTFFPRTLKNSSSILSINSRNKQIFLNLHKESQKK